MDRLCDHADSGRDTVTETYKKAVERINHANALLITASNGFSISEGLHIFAQDQAFKNLFGDFQRNYGVRCILEGCMTRYPCEEVKWAWWSRLIWHYSGAYTGSAVMQSLKKLVGDKPYFIITSNGEYHFELAGFGPEQIYEVEGSWQHMQCANACHATLYPAPSLIKEMAAKEHEGRIPSELVPRCPKCGGAMQIHIPNGSFIPNRKQQERYFGFLEQYRGKKITVLELGIGMRNRLIKAPVMEWVAQEPDASYITVNKGEIYIPGNIAERSVGLDGDMREILRALGELYENWNREWRQ